MTFEPDGLAIRALSPSHADAVSVLEIEIFGAEAWSRAQVEEELASPWTIYLGAFDGARLVGYAGAKGGVEGDLMTLAVLATHRGTGLGRALAERLLEEVASRGMRKIFLEVRESNRAARGLYANLGFKEIGVVADYYRSPPEDAVTMVKDGLHRGEPHTKWVAYSGSSVFRKRVAQVSQEPQFSGLFCFRF